MKQMIIMMLLTIMFTAIGVRMFQMTIEPALGEGHGRLLDRYTQWGYSHE